MKKSTLRVFLLVNIIITLIYGMCMGLLYTTFPILGVILTCIAGLHVLLVGCAYYVIAEEDAKSRFK